MELRSIAEWVIRTRLLMLTGVAEVFVQGGDRNNIKSSSIPRRFWNMEPRSAMLKRLLRESNINTSGGFATKGKRSVRFASWAD